MRPPGTVAPKHIIGRVGDFVLTDRLAHIVVFFQAWKAASSWKPTILSFPNCILGSPTTLGRASWCRSRLSRDQHACFPLGFGCVAVSPAHPPEAYLCPFRRPLLKTRAGLESLVRCCPKLVERKGRCEVETVTRGLKIVLGRVCVRDPGFSRATQGLPVAPVRT